MIRTLGSLGVGFIGGYMYANMNMGRGGRNIAAGGDGKMISNEMQQTMKEGKEKLNDMKEKFEDSKDSMKNAVKKDWNKMTSADAADKHESKQDSQKQDKDSKSTSHTSDVQNKEKDGNKPGTNDKNATQNDKQSSQADGKTRLADSMISQKPKQDPTGKHDNPQVPTQEQNKTAVSYKGKLSNEDKNNQLGKASAGTANRVPTEDNHPSQPKGAGLDQDQASVRHKSDKAEAEKQK